MTKSSSAKPTISVTVIVLNCLLIILLLIHGYKEYFGQNELAMLTGQHFGVREFISENMQQICIQFGIAVMLLLGTILEMRKLRLIAGIVNLAIPLSGFVLLLVQISEHWNPETSGETEQLLFLLAVPLGVMVLVYAAIYYRRQRPAESKSKPTLRDS
ncbi:MAG: hypothetical protein M3R43_03700 [Acidobacteriota bacterium]|nr:hypothetical protein [Acidobacteriota bacterium]